MRALALLLVLPLGACEDDPPRLQVSVCGDAPGLDAVRLVLRDEDGRERRRGRRGVAPRTRRWSTRASRPTRGRWLTWGCLPTPAPRSARRSLGASLPPPAGTGWLLAVGLRDGVEVVRGEVRVAGDTARVVLRAVCAGVMPARAGLRRGRRLRPVPVDPGPCPTACGAEVGRLLLIALALAACTDASLYNVARPHRGRSGGAAGARLHGRS
ncbi:MAG: hypothetical protein R3F43_30095 [bacterium]